MPDWSYRTLFRPVLFALPERFARDLALGTIGTLARTPLGPQTIDFLGHMRAPPELSREVLGRRFDSPIGIAAELDPSGYALAGLARFGVGFVEIGPLTLAPPATSKVQRDDQQQTIVVDRSYTHVHVDLALPRLAAIKNRVPAIVRLTADDFAREIALRLVAARDIDLAAVALHCDEATFDQAMSAVDVLPPSLPLLVAITADCDVSAALRLVESARQHSPRCHGVLITGTIATREDLRIGAPARGPALRLTAALREAHPASDFAIVAGGGVHEPQHAIDLVEAGADLVHIDSGLVFSGPGLVKRTNELLLSQRSDPAPSTEEHPARFAWFWMWLMGLSMLGGGTLALGIAGTRVVLPYDEHFVGMSRAELDAINPRLLAFMSHDRVTLAGTMLAIGILYSGLASHAVRRGLHWAWVAVLVSALTGFASFFTFLGFGYFEPFHAFVTALMFQFLLLSWHAPLGVRRGLCRVPPVEDWRWRMAQWGQLLLVIEGLVIITAGIVICTVGSTSVFVPEDLEFMETCSAALAEANPRLLSLIAHDRATFGGMLVSCGLTTLMATLWGFAAGRAWLFSTLLYAGSVGYICAIAVHYLVGYIDLGHLLPAFGGLALHWLALALSAPYLLWREYREPALR